MFDVDGFIADCVATAGEAQRMLAVKEVLDRALHDPALLDALPPSRAGITRLHVTPELSVLHVVWGPGMALKPHDHRMWAVIGLSNGGEDNTFYRRTPQGLTVSGGKELRARDICVLGDDAVHAVANPTDQFAGAIHIYGGDFFATDRSEWDPATLEERPYDVEDTLRAFEASNRTVPG
jgi:predicted metal-dependent enzyme (double-stranded beta helix superfamily)